MVNYPTLNFNGKQSISIKHACKMENDKCIWEINNCNKTNNISEAL